MEEKLIILDLFNEGVSFTERVYPQNREYYSKVSMAERQMEKLKNHLTTEQIEMLEDFLEIQNSHDAIYNEKHSGLAYRWELDLLQNLLY